MSKNGQEKNILFQKKTNLNQSINAKQIVSMPRVNSEIIGGKASISGDFSEEEIDKMIEILKGE